MAAVLPASTCGLESVVSDGHRNGNLKGLVVKRVRRVPMKKEDKTFVNTSEHI